MKTGRLTGGTDAHAGNSPNVPGNGNDEDSLVCHSLNPDPKYQPFTVRFSDIYGMYRVLMCMALK